MNYFELYQEGERAFENGLSLWASPYNGDQEEAWQDGWRNAQRQAQRNQESAE